MKTTTFTRIISTGALASVLVFNSAGCSSDRHDHSALRYEHQGQSHAFAGKITDIDRGDNEVTVRSDDLKHTFKLAPDAVIVTRDDRRAFLKDLRTGDRVVVSYFRGRNADVAFRIVPEGFEASRTYGMVDEYPVGEKVYTGVVTGIDRDDSVLKLNMANPSKENAELPADRTFKISPRAHIAVGNNDAATLDDIHIDDHVTVAFNEEAGDRVVYQIAPAGTVFSRATESPVYDSTETRYRPTSNPTRRDSDRTLSMEGTLVKIDDETRTVTVRTSADTYTFRFSDNAEIITADAARARSLRSLRVGDKVEITYTEESDGRTARVLVVKGAERPAE